MPPNAPTLISGVPKRALRGDDEITGRSNAESRSYRRTVDRADHGHRAVVHGAEAVGEKASLHCHLTFGRPGKIVNVIAGNKLLSLCRQDNHLDFIQAILDATECLGHLGIRLAVECIGRRPLQRDISDIIFYFKGDKLHLMHPRRLTAY